MGYTRYWKRTEKPMDIDFVNFCFDVFDTCKKLGITIRNAYGDDRPIVTEENIAFNGDATRDDKDLSYDSFVLDNRTGYEFCKTARKPYDYAVRTILREALTRGYITDLSDDGVNEEIVSDNEFNC